jgi:diguanylate cyclase (GGDEF)-like protein
LEEANRKIAELAYRDPLTGLANRRTLEETLAREIERGNRLGVPLAAIMMDIDHFKSINDRYGHAMGDRVLQSVAGQVSRHARPYDIVARYGGEEFLIIMPGCTLEQGLSAAERFRRLIWEMRVEGLNERVSASFGVAVLFPGQSSNDWIHRTDQAMYRAKQNGRNRVEYDLPDPKYPRVEERNGHAS